MNQKTYRYVQECSQSSSHNSNNWETTQMSTTGFWKPDKVTCQVCYEATLLMLMVKMTPSTPCLNKLHLDRENDSYLVGSHSFRLL